MSKIIITTFAAALLITGCAKVKVGSADLSITTSSQTYKVGDTITFQLEGNPDNIIFYSGDLGHNYEYRTRTAADNDLQVNFNTWVRYGDPLKRNLYLMVSNDFEGVYDVEHLQKATWQDVTQLANFSLGTDQTPSGTISLKPFLGSVDTALFYVAFRYLDTMNTKGQNNWIVRTFSADKVSPEGNVTNMAVMSSGGWKAINVKNTNKVWSITTAQLQMPNSAATETDNEDWVITKGFSVRPVAPDAGVALKNISTLLPQYKHVYETPGTYKVVFEASNVRYNGEDKLVKEMTLTITP
ncbi:MAG: DUF5017 domain-containing protein [Candidatus Pseudobacter hemicellulosilyticus]|uniref:DUF5017 domain-containing protein n=1 Tax=Candidatus Pseudobacter hemicellulosilyticus TaxID=3121375 RepID=A0AAJ5WUK8_9BACT|nr:MAG: DUF5017 domain-containing protein [Pseudobacter sp.]